MSNPATPDSHQPTETSTDNGASFADLLAQHEKGHSHKSDDGSRRLDATVVAVTTDSVLLDIGYKSEGILPLAEFQAAPEGYYSLSRFKVAAPKDWSSLEQAFAEKTTIMGTVTGVVKGGLTVDVGVRAFMPASRSGARDAAEMEKLVEQEIRCRIIKLDVADEDVVVDRRAVAEEEERGIRERRFSEIKEGETMSGTVRSLTDYGAFVDIGGVDGLLHVGDISWSRISKPSDVLTVDQQIEALVLKVDADKRRISLGMKQLQPHPWDQAAEKYTPGERVRGVVTRIVEFGAFVELAPGVEGLIHISEMSWGKKVRRASDVVKPGENVEAVVLGVNQGVGTVVEGPVTSLAKFGAFIQIAEGIEGMIHIGDISAEKRLNHPQEALKMGQVVKAQVLEVDTEKRRVKLGIKQMVPSSLDEYIAEHKEGDSVTGRMVEISGGLARVELGEGVQGTCRMAVESDAKAAPAEEKPAPGTAKADLSSLSSMLQARWKSGAPTSGPTSKPRDARTGQIHSFRISKLDPATKKIELEMA